LYGKPVVPIKDEIRKKIIGEEEVYEGRPADLLDPELDKYRNEIKQYIEQEEDVLSYALFPQVAMNFFKQRMASRYKIETDLLDEEYKTHPV
jgi:oxaloacetate decarboxylase alpha subunit